MLSLKIRLKKLSEDIQNLERKKEALKKQGLSTWKQKRTALEKAQLRNKNLSLNIEYWKNVQQGPPTCENLEEDLENQEKEVKELLETFEENRKELNKKLLDSFLTSCKISDMPKEKEKVVKETKDLKKGLDHHLIKFRELKEELGLGHLDDEKAMDRFIFLASSKNPNGQGKITENSKIHYYKANIEYFILTPDRKRLRKMKDWTNLRVLTKLMMNLMSKET